MFKVKIAVAAIIFTGVLLAFLSNVVPLPHLTGSLGAIVDEATLRSTLFGFSLSITFGVGSALLLLLGLHGFSGAFRRTYYFICAGLITQGLGGLVFLATLFTGTAKQDWTVLLAELPLVIGIVIVYWGYIKYSQLLRMNTVLAKPLYIAIFYAILMAIVWMLPHRTDIGVKSEFLFDLARSLQAVEIVTYCLISALVLSIRSVAGPMYSHPLMWFMLGTITAFPPTLALFIQDYSTFGGKNLESLSILFIVNSLLTLISGYSFNKLARLPVTKSLHSNSNALIDSILFLSSLVSKPSEIDPILDRLRGVTSHQVQGKPFTMTPQDETELKNIYKDLEDYLVTKEQLRELDRKSLTDLVRERFNVTPNEQAAAAS